MMTQESHIAQLILRERQGRDRGWWAQMADAYWPDSVVRLTWFHGTGPDFAAASEAMAGRGDLSVHRTSPSVVRVHDDRAWAETPAAIEVRTKVDGVLVDLTSYTRLVHRLEQREETWRISSLDVIYERDAVAPVVPGTPLPLSEDQLGRFRAPYAVLAWHLDRRGYPVDPDLLGDDRPAERDAFYARTAAWLHD